MGIEDFIDIIIVAFMIYYVIQFVLKTNLHNLTFGIVLLVVALMLSTLFGLKMISTLLQKAFELGLLAIVIIFQPELRNLLERLGKRLNFAKMEVINKEELSVDTVVEACEYMAETKTGALIIFERQFSLSDVIMTGSVINANVNAELIKNIFYNKAPLHDGAMIISGDRIVAAGCVLPHLTKTNLSKDLGMRHRAGIGMSEQSDALVIIVSEETGSISLAIDGTLKRHLSGESLKAALMQQISNNGVQETLNNNGIISTVISYLRAFFKDNEKTT